MAKAKSTKKPKKAAAPKKEEATPINPAAERNAIRREYAAKMKGADAATRRALRAELQQKLS